MKPALFFFLALFMGNTAFGSSKNIALIGGDSWTPSIPSRSSANTEVSHRLATHPNITRRYGNTVEEPYRHEEVGIRVFVDRQFSRTEQKLLEESVDDFIRYYLHDDVIECAYKKADDRNHVWTRRRFENEMLFLFRHYQDIDKERKIYITSFYHANSQANAQANVSVFTTPDYKMEKVSRENYFHINVNAAQLQKRNDPAEWAGVIAHEILHNIGFLHPILIKLENALTSIILTEIVYLR